MEELKAARIRHQQLSREIESLLCMYTENWSEFSKRYYQVTCRRCIHVRGVLQPQLDSLEKREEYHSLRKTLTR